MKNQAYFKIDWHLRAHYMTLIYMYGVAQDLTEPLEFQSTEVPYVSKLRTQLLSRKMTQASQSVMVRGSTQLGSKDTF